MKLKLWIGISITVAFLSVILSGCAPVTPKPGITKSETPGETYLVYRNALDAGELTQARRYLSALKLKALQGRSDGDALSELRVLHPVSDLVLVSEPEEGDRSTVTVKGAAMGLTAMGTIEMLREASGWKVLGESWDLGSDEKTEKPAAPDATLHEAAQAGDGETVRALIASGADVNAKDNVGRSPLFWAANFNHTAVISNLIDAGAMVNARNDSDETALMIATAAGSLDAAAALIDSGADVHTVDSTGRTALIQAAQVSDWVLEQMKNGEADAVRMINALIEAGADVNAVDKYQQRSALMETTLNGRTGMTQALLNAGADSNKQAYGVTALMEATKAGHADIVKMFLDAGVDTTPKDMSGKTALDWAADYPEIAEMLRAKGAPGKPPQKKKRLAGSGVPEATPEQQQQARDKLRAKGYSEVSGMMMLNAAAQGDLAAVKLFLEAGIPINFKDERDHASTALTRAVSHPDSPELALFLIIAGADVEAGIFPPLINASEKCRFTEVVELMIKAGADPNGKAPGGATPLMMAKMFNCEENVKALLAAGAKE